MFNREVFNYKTINENMIYYLNFCCYKFENDNITFDIFVKKLSTRINIEISKVIKILSKTNYIKKDVSSEQIFNKMFYILEKFNDLDNDNKIHKMFKLLKYIIINRTYFRTNKSIFLILKKKLIYLMYNSNLLEKSDIAIYYFIIFNLKHYSFTTIVKNSILKINDLDDIDFILDNPIENNNFIEYEDYLFI